MQKVIIAIDPGSPKNRDKSATTAVFIGEYYDVKKIKSFDYIINSATKENDENEFITSLLKECHKYEVIDIVIEEYKNYSWNLAVNNFSKNETSQLIGKIKYAFRDKNITEQSTVNIKTKYNNEILVKLGILEKPSSRYRYTKDFGKTEYPESRHELDALRHYLLRREKLKMLNYTNIDIF